MREEKGLFSTLLSVAAPFRLSTVARVPENYLGRRTSGKDADAGTKSAGELQPIVAGHQRGGPWTLVTGTCKLRGKGAGAGCSSDALRLNAHRWYELCFRKTTGTPDSQTTERERVTFCI